MSLGRRLKNKDNPAYKEVMFQIDTEMKVYKLGIPTFVSTDIKA